MNPLKEVDFAVTLCSKDGIITYMNNKAVRTFEKDGGLKLIGSNVLDCHPEPSKSQLADMLKTEKKNVYTIEKNGVKKLIYQTPYYEKGVYSGFAELSLELPEQMENFIRS
ncbi:MAG: diguanylate cyclase [Candidatus Kapaibacterium sp.]